MGIFVEFNPDLCLRSFETEGRASNECLPEKLVVGEIYNFSKKGQRNFFMLGEIPLRETKGNGVLSKTLASVVLLEATHFVIEDEIWTRGKYEVKETYNPSDNRVYFDGLEKIK